MFKLKRAERRNIQDLLEPCPGLENEKESSWDPRLVNQLGKADGFNREATGSSLAESNIFLSMNVPDPYFHVHPTDGATRIFSDHLIVQPVIEPTSVELLLPRTLARTLHQLSYWFFVQNNFALSLFAQKKLRTDKSVSLAVVLRSKSASKRTQSSISTFHERLLGFSLNRFLQFPSIETYHSKLVQLQEKHKIDP